MSDIKAGQGVKAFQWKEGRFKLHTGKKLFTVRVVRHWDRNLRVAMEVPSLEMFKSRQDGALRNLV